MLKCGLQPEWHLDKIYSEGRWERVLSSFNVRCPVPHRNRYVNATICIDLLAYDDGVPCHSAKYVLNCIQTGILFFTKACLVKSTDCVFLGWLLCTSEQTSLKLRNKIVIFYLVTIFTKLINYLLLKLSRSLASLSIAQKKIYFGTLPKRRLGRYWEDKSQSRSNVMEHFL